MDYTVATNLISEIYEEQTEKLDDSLNLKDGDILTLIRLTMLAGRMWQKTQYFYKNIRDRNLTVPYLLSYIKLLTIQVANA